MFWISNCNCWGRSNTQPNIFFQQIHYIRVLPSQETEPLLRDVLHCPRVTRFLISTRLGCCLSMHAQSLLTPRTGKSGIFLFFQSCLFPQPGWKPCRRHREGDKIRTHPLKACTRKAYRYASQEIRDVVQSIYVLAALLTPCTAEKTNLSNRAYPYTLAKTLQSGTYNPFTHLLQDHVIIPMIF